MEEKSKKRIVICTNAYPPNFIGGAELIAHYHALQMKKSGHSVVIFAGESQPQDKRYSLRQETYDGLDVWRVNLQPRDYQPDFINFVHRNVEDHFERLLDSFAPDIVHFHNLIGLSVGLIHLARRRGIRTVLTVHDTWGFCQNSTLMKDSGAVCLNYVECAECMPSIHDGDDRGIPIRMRKDYISLILLEVDTFISPSRYLADAYIDAGFPKEKFRVIPNGIDLQRFRNLPKTGNVHTLRFSFIGHFGGHKGVHILISALSLLDKKYHYKVNLVGEGGMRASYERQIREKGLEKKVRFLGKIDNCLIEAVYSETDVLVLPSICPENQPVTIAEAMASNIPVIASRIGGIPELVDDGVTGYLFEAGNAEDLADRMTEFLDHPDRMRTFGKAAYRKIADRSFETQVAKVLGVYEEACCNGDSPYFAIPLCSVRKLGQSLPRFETLIVCSGRRVDPECARAMNAFVKRREELACAFVMSDWVDEDIMSRAAVFWIVDPESEFGEALAALRHGMPLLVPGNNTELRDLCSSANCGLYYTDSADASECLDYLTTNRAAAKALGRNGRLFLEGYERADSLT